MVTFMMIFIIPKITASFDQAGSELPYLTMQVIAISDFFREKWMYIIVFIL